MENGIKEQLSLFAGRVSAETMRANQVRLYLSGMAYVLVSALRRLGLAGTDLARAQATTIRLRLFKIGARVWVTARRRNSRATEGLQGGAWPQGGQKRPSAVGRLERTGNVSPLMNRQGQNSLFGPKTAPPGLGKVSAGRTETGLCEIRARVFRRSKRLA